MLHEDSLFLTSQSLHYGHGPDAGPPLVLLHGVLRQWSDYVPVLPPLMLRWQVYALDFRGHGQSSRTPDQYLVADYFHDVASFLSHQLREPAVVYGHSLGAMVALQLAAEMRDHVRAIVLEDPPFQTMGTRIRDTQYLSQFQGVQRLLRANVPAESLAAELAALPITLPGQAAAVRFGDLRDGPSLRWLARCLTLVDPAVVAPIVEERWLTGYEMTRHVQRVRCPTLVLQADAAAGGMLGDDDAELMEGTIRDCVRVRFPRVGHSIRWSAADAWLRVVANYLESVR